MAIAVFGDVHGRADILGPLLEAFRSQYGDEIPLFSVGDLIDRGPDSKGVLELCIQYRVQGILGNHETWLHQLLVHSIFDGFALHPNMGGKATVASYGVDPHQELESLAQGLLDQMPQTHKDFISGLPVHRRVVNENKTYYLTHGGLKKQDAHVAKTTGSIPVNDKALFEKMAAYHEETLLWVGFNPLKPEIYKPNDGGIQVFGHTPVRPAQSHSYWAALDTGCGTRPPHILTLMIFPSRKTISFNALSGKISSPGCHEFTF